MSRRRESVHLEGPTLGYSMMTELAAKVSVVTPFVVWPVMAVSGLLLHLFWPDNSWVLASLSLVTVLFAVFVYYLTHSRKGLASEHAAFTVLAYGTILCMVDHMGWTTVTAFLMLFGVGFICTSWSVRNAIRHHDEKAGMNISSLFETAGMEGTKMHIKPKPNENRKRWSLPWSNMRAIESTPDVPNPDGKQRRAAVSRRREAKILLKPGATVDRLVKGMGGVESAAEVPPGTFTVTPNGDNARVADVIISDPRAIKKPILYPGPSYKNASIADTISVGMYQDGTECEFDILGLQVQIMGMIGSGKSLGAGWSSLAEIITRKDVVVWGIDVTKGFQTLGPLQPALHRLATTPAEALQMLSDANALIKPRTDYLAGKGLGKWQRNCGLKYLVVWLEEVPDIMEALGDDGEAVWIKSVKAARSAGITFVWSLQRADYSQIPTITRGQAAKWCFGVADSHEASFGLSTIQDNADCSPEDWGNRHPGKYYLDAPGIPEDKVPMPARTWYWGPDDSRIREHALLYPASEREPDELMQRILSRSGTIINVPDTPVKRAPINTPSDDTQLADRGEDDDMASDDELDEDITELTTDFHLERSKVDPLPPDEARLLVRDWLVARAGQTVQNSDLLDVRKQTGYSRQWGYKVMAEFESSGLVRRHDSDDGVSWIVTDLDSVLSQDN